MKKALLKIGEYAAILAVLFWGVPYYINTEVERRMGELVPDAAQSPAVVALETKVEAVEKAIVRVEGKVDTFSTAFMGYLERQSQ